MPKTNGWVKIHRKILSTALSASQFKFFVGSILLAKSPKSKDSGLVELSVRQLSTELCMSRSEIWRREKELEEMGMITLLDKGFTINNYDYYQSSKSVLPAGHTKLELRDTGVICWVCNIHEILPPMKDYSEWLAARFQEHHIIPKPEGGDEPENRVQLCQICHKQAHHNQLNVKRDLSAASIKKLEFLQSKTVPYAGQLFIDGVTPAGLNVTPAGLNVTPAGRSVPSHETKLAHKTIKNNKKIKNIYTLPDWIDKDTWEAFLDMRKKKKAVPTERAIQLLIKELSRLKMEGNEPNEVLNQSIMRNYTGVFPLKGGRDGAHQGRHRQRELPKTYRSPEETFGE